MNRIKLILFTLLFFAVVIIGVFFLMNWRTNQEQQQAVIQQMKTLNRWETASYTVEQIIDSGNSGNKFQQFLFGDRILLVAHGTVVAGFDLENISSKNVHIDRKNISIQLPAPEILSTALDESKTRVYDRQKGILVHTNDNLESQARLSAVTKIKQAACTGGVLNLASNNARKQLTTMMQALGFSAVTITIPNGHC